MILSLVWQDVDKAGFSVENDIAYNIVKKHQYEDVADLQDLEPRDQAYRQHVRRIVGKLRAVSYTHLDVYKRQTPPCFSVQYARSASEYVHIPPMPLSSVRCSLPAMAS